MFSLDSTVTWLVIGLSFVVIGFIINYLNDMRVIKSDELINDKYSPIESVTNSKRRQRHIN